MVANRLPQFFVDAHPATVAKWIAISLSERIRHHPRRRGDAAGSHFSLDCRPYPSGRYPNGPFFIEVDGFYLTPKKDDPYAEIAHPLSTLMKVSVEDRGRERCAVELFVGSSLVEEVAMDLVNELVRRWPEAGRLAPNVGSDLVPTTVSPYVPNSSSPPVLFTQPNQAPVSDQQDLPANGKCAPNILDLEQRRARYTKEVSEDHKRIIADWNDGLTSKHLGDKYNYRKGSISQIICKRRKQFGPDIVELHGRGNRRQNL